MGQFVGQPMPGRLEGKLIDLSADQPGPDLVTEKEDRRDGDGVADPHQHHRDREIDPEEDR